MKMSSKSVQNVLQYVIISFAILISFGENLEGEFVFDDSVAIVKNRDVTDASTTWEEIFSHDFWGNNITSPTSHKSFRPLTILLFNLENQLYGLNPRHMKTTNLFLHIIISSLLIPLYKLIFKDTNFGPAFFGSLLFAIHPIHCEAVCCCVGRADLLAALFFTISLIMYGMYLKRKGRSLMLTILMFSSIFGLTGLSMLCKETGITLLATCAAIDFLKSTNLKYQQILRLVTLGAMSMVLIYFRLKAINFEGPKFRNMDNPLAASQDYFTRISSQNYLYFLNFWLLLCPDWLSFDWALGSIPLVESISDYRNIFTVILMISIVLAILSRKKEIHLSFALIVIPFLPASGLIRVGFVIAERILYIPSIGFCFMVSLGLRKMLKNYKKHRKLIYFGFAILIVSFVLKTRTRSFEWTKEDLLFRSAVRVCPRNAKVYYNIARLATDNEDKDTAFNYYKKAIELHPEYEAAHMNLGNLYREINALDEAERHLKKSVEIMEDLPAAWMNLGIVQAAMKNYQNALESYNRALKYKRNYPNCLYNIGNLYIEMQNTTMAQNYWNLTLKLNPKHSKAWANLLALFDNKGLLEEIIDTSEMALKFLPDDSAILFTRANAFGKLGKYDEAEIIYKKIIGFKPNYALYHANLGVLYHRWGKRELAIKYYRNALKLDGSLSSAQQNLNKLLGVL